jgi:hypothetical protein
MDGRTKWVGVWGRLWVGLLLALTGGCADAVGVQDPTPSAPTPSGTPEGCDDDSDCSGSLSCKSGTCTDIDGLSPTGADNLDRPAVATTPAGGLLTDRPGGATAADPLQPPGQTRADGRFAGAGAVLRASPDSGGRNLVLTGEFGGATHELRSERFTLIGGF